VGLVIGLAAPIVIFILLAGLVTIRILRPAETPVAASPDLTQGSGPTASAPSDTHMLAAETPLTSSTPAPGTTPTMAAPAPLLTPANSETAVAITATSRSQLPETVTATATTLPTATPVVTLTATPTPDAPASATPAPGATDGPSPTPTPTPTATAAAAWRFINLTFGIDPLDARHSLIYGEVVNATGVAQEITDFTGTFYNNQGQLVAGTEQLRPYWPLAVLPPGGQMPFELQVLNATGLTRAELGVLTTPREEAPRTDFTFENVNQSLSGEFYCLRGQLRNPGGRLNEYLVIVGLLYDSQNNLVKFADESDGPPIFAVGERLKSFEMCLAPPYPGVVRYELKAWGR